ncbi:MAG TPA: histidine phosphatase family protein [Sulfuricaulis sp.]|nr:histidine phosphatase family protein [Sulfuricaulis sp.]
MFILLVRHAKAEARSLLGLGAKRDVRRPLTDAGRKRMRRAAKALHRLVPAVDVIASSPLIRARETAEILAGQYDNMAVVDLMPLSPGGSEQELLDWLREQRQDAAVVLVGHEPDLGFLVSWLLTGKKSAFTPLRKGAACLIRFDEAPAAGGGVLEWMLTPKLFDKL